MVQLRCCLPGKACAACCTIFSIWGFLTLVVVGICVDANYSKIDEGKVTPGDAGAVATQTYIAAVIYFLFIVGCGARWGYIYWSEEKQLSQKFVGRVETM
eukprot:TRINITY_DN258_c0_g1_i1.p1 TRINITY_DN258_c0_g1~~TRINITY_DN258_c0_g1_i1.p1  ORF type:complete len:100 (-),score=14.04 TRINITY_DN258_c0_g1_i1:91-390(-)